MFCLMVSGAGVRYYTYYALSYIALMSSKVRTTTVRRCPHIFALNNGPIPVQHYHQNQWKFMLCLRV